MTALQLAEPETVRDACEILSDRAGEAKIIAGGTAVVLMMQQRLIRPDLLVSLNRIAGLSSIEVDGDHIRIGATTTLADVASSTTVRSLVPVLARASGLVGNIRVRNAATLAGNLAEADYASDLPAVLSCLRATCTVQGSSGTRRIPVEELITGFYSTALSTDEIITAIDVPTTANRRSNYLKYVSRSSEDRPCVGVAGLLEERSGNIEDIRIVIGAVGPRPVFLEDVCSSVTGRRLDDDGISAIADGYAHQIDPLDDQRGSSWYRREMIRVFVRRALQELSAGDA